jgi:rubrerythrin
MLEDATPRKALEFAVATEKLGAQIYEKLAKRFEGSEELKELFTSLAKDEQAHEREFRALLDRLPADAGPVQYEQEQYLRAMAISDVFSDDKGISKNIDKITTREDALERALSLEKNTLMYYTALRDVVGTSEAVDAIIAAEKRHVIRVMQYMITGERPKPL